MAEHKSTQYGFLYDLSDKRREAKIFLTNGFQMVVRIIDYDDACILVEDPQKKNCRKMIYKHAISTIEVVK